MAKNLKITKEQLHKLELGRIREEQKMQGFFDGRFAPKTQKDKSKYTRKNKHKNRNDKA